MHQLIPNSTLVMPICAEKDIIATMLKSVQKLYVQLELTCPEQVHKLLVTVLLVNQDINAQLQLHQFLQIAFLALIVLRVLQLLLTNANQAFIVQQELKCNSNVTMVTIQLLWVKQLVQQLLQVHTLMHSNKQLI